MGCFINWTYMRAFAPRKQKQGDNQRGIFSESEFQADEVNDEDEDVDDDEDVLHQSNMIQIPEETPDISNFESKMNAARPRIETAADLDVEMMGLEDYEE